MNCTVAYHKKGLKCSDAALFSRAKKNELTGKKKWNAKSIFFSPYFGSSLQVLTSNREVAVSFNPSEENSKWNKQQVRETTFSTFFKHIQANSVDEIHSLILTCHWKLCIQYHSNWEMAAVKISEMVWLLVSAPVTDGFESYGLGWSTGWPFWPSNSSCWQLCHYDFINFPSLTVH